MELTVIITDADGIMLDRCKVVEVEDDLGAATDIRELIEHRFEVEEVDV